MLFQNMYTYVELYLKDDMIELFSDPTMRNVNLDATVIGNDGNPVEGTRVCVVREVLTSFWQLVYHSLTVRTQEKVPCVWHELQNSSELFLWYMCCHSISLVWRGKRFKQLLESFLLYGL